MSNIIGGTGLDSIRLEVTKIGSHGRLFQKLILTTYSYTNYEDIVFTRYLRPDMSFGVDPNATAGRWKLEPNTAVGSWLIFPLHNKSTELNVPGICRFITQNQLATFFANDNIVFTGSGMFETLPYDLPLEHNGTDIRMLQKYTTYDNPQHIYQRTITALVNTDDDLNRYPNGIGGGYKSVSSVGDWVEITNK